MTLEMADHAHGTPLERALLLFAAIYLALIPIARY
jgi:hypothetical protein